MNVTRQKDLGIRRPGESSGKYADAVHDEANQLTFPPFDERAARLEAIVTRQVNDYGAGIEPEIRRAFEDLSNDNAKDLWLHLHESEENPSSYSIFDRVNELGALGYSNVDQITGGVDAFKTNRALLRNIVDLQISPERLEVIRYTLARPNIQNSIWAKEALANADLTALADLHADRSTLTYASLIAVHDEARAATISKALQLPHVKTRFEYIESGVDLETLNGVIAKFPKADSLSQIVWVRRGHDAASVTRWGREAAASFTPEELRAAFTDKEAKAAGSILSTVRYSTGDRLENTRELLDAGFRTGREVTKMRDVLELSGQESWEKLAAARRLVDVDELSTFVSTSIPAPKRREVVDAVPQIRQLIDHGHPKFRSVSDQFLREVHPDSQDNSLRTVTDALTHAVAIIESGLTAERIGVLTRAGIPYSQVVAFKDSTTEWEDGAPYRDQVTRQKRSWFEKGYAWATTESTFR